MERNKRIKEPKEPREVFDFPHFAVVRFEDQTYDYFDVWTKVAKRSIRPIKSDRENSEWNFEANFSGKWYKGKFIKRTGKISFK